MISASFQAIRDVHIACARTGTASAASQGMQEARRTLKARREHDKGDGNFPTPTRLPIDERPEDRLPDDLPKERDPLSAPKGNATAGQDDRNPDLNVRDDYTPVLPRPATSFEDAI